MDGTKPLDAAIAALITALQREGGMPFAAVLYGSAARGDWSPGQSDVNLLLVVDDPAPVSLGRLGPAVRAWHEQGFTPPLLMGRDEWRRATDVFPIEITDMQVSYRVLAGEDPVAGLRVAEQDLRRALEAALRGKLIRLRQAYLRFADQPAILAGFASAMASELLVLLRATARLLGRSPAADPAASITALEDILGPGAHAVREVVARRRVPEWSCEPALFAACLDAIARLVVTVDTHSSRGAD
jgi:hypothetical protein